MFLANIRFALRHLVKNKGFSFINILGLAVGIAASLVIFKYISYETSFDDFHEKGAQIYRVQYEKISRDSHDKSAGLAAGAAADLTNAYPEVLAYSKLWSTDHMSNVVSLGDEHFNMQNMFYADDNFFEFFSFELLHGNKDKALEEVNSLVISETEALRFFGRTDVLGEEFELTNSWGKQNGIITGVFKDLPPNTHFRMEALVSFKTLSQVTNGEADVTYGWNAFVTYLQLAEGSDPKVLESKLPDFVSEKYAELIARDVQPVLKLRALEDIYLTSNIRFEVGPIGDKSVVQILAIVSVLILVLAYFNYINLSTVKSLERAKEIGVRKVNGAHRTSLINQFLIEAIVVNTLSIVLGFTLMQVCLPFVGGLLDKPLASGVFIDIEIAILLMALLTIGSLFSGLYPALLLSKTHTILALKGKTTDAGKDSFVRKGLLVLQFGIMSFLLVGSLVVREQIEFMLNKDLGFDNEQVLVIKAPSVEDAGQFIQDADRFKSEVTQQASVLSATNSSIVPGIEIGWINNDVRIEGAPDNAKRAIPFVGVDADFVTTMGLKLLTGRSFDEALKTDFNSILLSDEAVKDFGFANPEEALGQTIILGGDRRGKVIGVVEDYHQQSMKLDYEPIIYRYTPEANGYFSIRLSSNEASAVLDNVASTYASVFENSPFDYFFLDEFYDRQFREDRAFATVINFFTILAIWISGLGLIGLTSYSVLQRRKEIGIRKVLGARVQQLIGLISGRFVKLALIALLLFVPLSIYATGLWLDSYSFSAELGLKVYLIPVLLVMLITLLTTGILSFRSAVVNPVRSLRNE